MKYGLRSASLDTAGNSTLIRWPSTAWSSCSHAAAFGQPGSKGRIRLAAAAPGRGTARPIAPASNRRLFTGGLFLLAGPLEGLHVERFIRSTPAWIGEGLAEYRQHRAAVCVLAEQGQHHAWIPGSARADLRGRSVWTGH